LMPRKVIPFHQELSPSFRDFVDIYKVTEGTAILDEIECYSDVADPDIVLLAVYYGNLQVYPAKGQVSITQRAFRDRIGFKYPNYTPIRLYLVNKDGANAHKVWGTIELEVV